MNQSRILLFSIMLLLSAIGCALSMVGGGQNEPFVTEPWQDFDAYMCGTDWISYPIGDGTQDWEGILSQRIADLEADMELTYLYGGSAVGRCWQTEFPNVKTIEMFIEIPQHIADDVAELGYRIRSLIILLDEYGDQIVPPNDGNLIIYFTISDNNIRVSRRWAFQYSQAVDAVEAGLDGEELFAVGRVRER